MYTPGRVAELIEAEKALHPMVADVIFRPPCEDISDRERLNLVGLANYEPYSWDTQELQSSEYSPQGGTYPGSMTTGISPHGDFRVAICCQAEPCISQVVVLLHEFGHVDDIERRINLVRGRAVDFVAAELYAHRYACRRMKECGFELALCKYLKHAIEALRNEPADVHQAAAIQFLETNEYRMYKQMLAPYEEGG